MGAFVIEAAPIAEQEVQAFARVILLLPVGMVIHRLSVLGDELARLVWRDSAAIDANEKAREQRGEIIRLPRVHARHGSFQHWN